jgi:hypothetical protein
VNTQIIADSAGPQQQKSNLAHLTRSLGDAFAASTPVPTNPAPEGDDPQAIERAEALLRRPNRFTGEDRFAAAVACGLLFRAENRSEPDALDCLERLNLCEPPLASIELGDAIYVAYHEPHIADRIIADALSGATNDAPGALEFGSRPSWVTALRT